MEAEILAASENLRVPGSGAQRVLSPAAAARIAASTNRPGWEVEAAALDAGVVPLHYLRNLSTFGFQGQARLLRAEVGLAGRAQVLERAVELLSLNGVGRFVLLDCSSDGASPGSGDAVRLASAARNGNAGCSVECRRVALRGGNPADALRVDAAACCLDDSADEQLLQFACRMAKTPLVLAGVEGDRGQATTVLPGDPGVALVYRVDHPHIEPRRHGAYAGPHACRMVGAWIAEQVIQLLLNENAPVQSELPAPASVSQRGLLRRTLLYADLGTGELVESSL